MKKLLYILLGLLVFTSCEDVITVELNESDIEFYTVEAQLTSLSEPWVFLSKTVPVTVDESQKGISNAMVVLSDNATSINQDTLVEDISNPGYYTVSQGKSYLGVPGRSYTLTITTPDGVVLSSTETLHPVEPIDSIMIYPSARGEQRFLGIFTFGWDTPGLGNNYKWNIYRNGEYLSETDYLVIANDEMVDGNYVQFEIFTDFHNPAEPSERILQLGDTIHVEQTSITKFAFDFYSQVFGQAGGGSIFSVPAANLPCNIFSSDGKDVYGIFDVSDVSVSNTIIIDNSIEELINKD